MRSHRHARPVAHPGRWPNPIGTIEDCLENLPHTLLLSSRERGWRDVTLDVHPGSGPFELQVPPLDHVTLMMAQAGPSRTEGVLDARSYEHAVEPFDINLYPPFMRHTCWGDSTPRALTLSITADFLDGAVRTLSEGMLSAPVFEPTIARRDPTMMRFGEILLAELRTPPHPAQAMLVSALANAIAIHLIRDYAEAHSSSRRTSGPRLSTRTLALIKDYLHTHVTGSVQLDELAAIAGVSRFHFIRAFRATTGLTPMQYVERNRLEWARRLLERGALSLAEIAQLVGYADQSHFTRRFKRHIGCTPGAYAKEYGRVSVPIRFP
jgi:AraC family transcriptional regulator